MSVDKYKIHQCIGKGNFGDVYKATDISNNTLVAVKVINLDESDEDIAVLIQEIQFLSKLRSPYITKYFETFINDMSMWIVMEYCGGGSCADLLKCYRKLNEETTAFIIRDVLRGLTYLHEENKVHRDIKLANILLTSYGEIKLADFGVSGEITMTQLKRNTFVGTPFWMAPEVIARLKTGYNEKADIWSTGITTIELVTGSPPLSQYDPMKILFEIPKKRPPLLTGVDFSENIKDFVRYCLIKDPKKRPSSSTLLHHKFLKNIKRNVNLFKLLEEKNKWSEKHHRNGKKPKYPLRVDYGDLPEYDPLIKWDFNTKKSYHTKSSPMEQTLLINNESPLLNMISLPPHSQCYELAMPTKLTSPLPPLQVTYSSQVSPGSPQKPQESPDRKLENTSHPVPIKFLDDVVLYSLQRLHVRAKASSTKVTIDKLMQNFIDYESLQPGLSEAFVEEILMLHIANSNPHPY